MKYFFLLLLFTFSYSPTNAQSFTQAADFYSKKKPAYITLISGGEVTGNIKSVKRKKGQITMIKFVLENGDKVEYTPEQIEHAFLPRNAFESFGNDLDNAYDLTSWGDESPEGDRIKDGYIYYETEQVMIKDEEYTLLMQMVNPHFNKAITVYHDPRASESASVGVAGFKVAGGVDKSYYVKFPGADKAVRIKKKDYEDYLTDLYGDCDKVKPEDSREMFWKDFPKHVYYYTQNCLE